MAGGRVLTVLVVLYAFDVFIALQELLTNGSDVSDLQVVEGAAVRTAAPVGEEQTLGEHLADVVALDGVCGDREEGRGRGHCLSALAAPRLRALAASALPARSALAASRTRFGFCVSYLVLVLALWGIWGSGI